MFLFEGLDYFYYIGLPVIVVILLIVLFLVIRNFKKKKYLLSRNNANNEMLINLGGQDNIIEAKATGSRLSLVLKDYSIVNESRLKELGVSSIIKMSNKITLVIGAESQDIFNLINNGKSH